MADAVRQMLKILGAVWLMSATAAAALLSRDDRAGAGFLWGLALGPIGLIVVWVRRPTWEHHWARARAGAEERRKEQAWREWRGH
jgi:hypothetical protein